MSKISEIDVGGPVKKWMEDRGWTCYAEVPCHDKVADIVATRYPVVAVVECKTTLTLALLSQIDFWIRIGNAHQYWIAVPTTRHMHDRDFAIRVCKEHGIGVLFVKRNGEISEKSRPKFWRDSKPSWKLNEAQTSQIPGTSGGGHWTPWKQSISAITMQVASGPKKIKDVVKSIKHHWKNDTSAVRCILKQIDNGIIKELERDGDTIMIRG